MADADLEEGLEQAKKKPRNFALILKGQTVVKMIVQKKPIREGDIMFARRESKGNDSLLGVCFRNGAELTLQVTGEVPTIKPIKIKEFINEETGLTVKPLWDVVSELAFVDEDDEPKTTAAQPQQQRATTPTATTATATTSQAATNTTSTQPAAASAIQQQDAPPPAPPPPPPPPQQSNDQNAKVTAALKKATPDIQRAIVAAPQFKDEILGLVARTKGLLKEKTDQSDQAMASFRELVALLATALKSGGGTSSTPPTQATQPQRLVTLQRSRLDWDSARKKLHAQLKSVEDAVYQECADADEYDQAEVRERVRVLDRLMEKLDERLIDVLDQALNAADPPARANFEKQATSIIGEYLNVVNSDPLVTAIDESGLVNVSIKQSMTTVLSDLAGRLAS